LSYRLIAAAAAVVALQGCASKPAPPPVPTEDLNIGISKTCTFTPVQPAAGSSVNSSLTMTNDGWCAVRTTEADGQPFQLGLVRQRPAHGTMLVQKLGGETRLEYTPNPGYTGTDSFTAALRPKSGAADATVRVAVMVTQGVGAPAAAAPAAQEHKPAASTSSTRRSTRRSSSGK
jgi:hypothetical protein